MAPSKSKESNTPIIVAIIGAITAIANGLGGKIVDKLFEVKQAPPQLPNQVQRVKVSSIVEEAPSNFNPIDAITSIFDKPDIYTLLIVGGILLLVFFFLKSQFSKQKKH
jgi:hypothetical protein